MQHQVIKDPGRVIGIGLLEGAIPDPVGGASTAGGVGASLCVVVRRHAHDSPAHQHGDLGDIATELLGVVLHAADSGQRVFLVAVDHLRQCLNVHPILGQRAVGLGGDTTGTDRPARTGGEFDPVRAFVLGDVLAVDLGRQHLLEGAVVSRHVYRILDAHAINVAALVLALQLWPGEAQTHGIQHGVADGVHVGRGGEQQLANSNLIARLGNASHPLLVQLT